jgi:hypothetical protein
MAVYQEEIDRSRRDVVVSLVSRSVTQSIISLFYVLHLEFALLIDAIDTHFAFYRERVIA